MSHYDPPASHDQVNVKVSPAAAFTIEGKPLTEVVTKALGSYCPAAVSFSPTPPPWQEPRRNPYPLPSPCFPVSFRVASFCQKRSQHRACSKTFGHPAKQRWPLRRCHVPEPIAQLF